jgi:hypothetical protein
VAEEIGLYGACGQRPASRTAEIDPSSAPLPFGKLRSIQSFRGTWARIAPGNPLAFPPSMAVMYRHFRRLQAVENEGRSKLRFDLPCAEKSRMDLFSVSQGNSD